MVMLNLLHNIALLVTLSVVFQILRTRLRQHGLFSKILTGALFGFTAIAGMLTPFIVIPGIIIDGRTIIMSVAGVFGGTLVTLVAAVVSGVYRIFHGGPGTLAGLLLIFQAGAIGLVVHYLLRRGRIKPGALSYLGMGALVHLLMLLIALILPGGVAVEVLEQIWLPVLTIYPLGTMLICLLFKDYEQQDESRAALQRRERLQRAMIDNSPDIISRFNRQHRFLLVNRQAELVTSLKIDDFLGKTFAELGFPAEQCALWEQGMEQALAECEIVEQEFRLPTPTGERIFNCRYIPEFSNAGGEDTVLCILRDITDVRESEQNYRLLFNSLSFGFAAHEIVTDASGQPFDYRFISVNSSFERLLGLRAEDVIGRTIREVIPDIEDGLLKKYFDVALTGRAIQIEHYVSALRRHFEVSAYSPRHGQFATLFQDITARKSAEHRQAVTANILATLNSVPDLTQSLKEILRLIQQEDNFDAVGIRLQSGHDFPYLIQNGFSAEFVANENSLAVRDMERGICLDESGRPCLECTCGMVISGQYDPENRNFTPHGSFWTNDAQIFLAVQPAEDLRLHPRNRCIHEGYRSVALIPIRVNNDTIGLLQLNDRRPNRLSAGIVGFFEEISDCLGVAFQRKRMEEALKKSVGQYRGLFELAVDGILIGDHDGYVTDANDRMCDIFGVPREQLLGRHVARMPFTPESIRRTPLRFDLLRKGEVVTSEREVRRPDDTLVTIEMRTKMMPDGSYQSIYRDITDRRHIEERLRQMEKMNAVGQLAGGIAHDFNNQLTGILSYAELLGDRLDDPGLRRYAEGIQTAALRSADITQKLLAFARKGQFLTLPTDMHKVIAETVEILTHSIDKRIRIEQVLRAQSATVSGDPSQLQNALLNLGLNSRDAMPGGGVLTIETANVTVGNTTDTRSTRELVPGEYLLLSVNDTGLGMSDEVKRHLFEPFFTTKEVGKGTGMGLAAVYGTVKGHKGAIAVESTPGVGTRFSIHLPLVPHLQAGGDASGSAREQQRSLRILAVDDETVVRELLGELLAKLGHSAILAADGLDAVEVYRKNWQEIDLVILDMQMPQMNGRDTFGRLRAINPGARVLLASGYSVDTEAQAVLEAGGAGFLQKPFMLRNLEDALAKADVGNIAEGR